MFWKALVEHLKFKWKKWNVERAFEKDIGTKTMRKWIQNEFTIFESYCALNKYEFVFKNMNEAIDILADESILSSYDIYTYVSNSKSDRLAIYWFNSVIEEKNVVDNETITKHKSDMKTYLNLLLDNYYSVYIHDRLGESNGRHRLSFIINTCVKNIVDIDRHYSIAKKALEPEKVFYGFDD